MATIRTTVGKSECYRDRLRIAFALTGACTVLACDAARGETYFDPRIGLDLAWLDNAELATNGAPKKDELVGQLRPRVILGHDGQNLQAFLDYRLQALYFQNEGQTQLLHQGELGAQFAVLPNWLYIDLGGSRTQTVIDPSQPINAGNLFQAGNLANSTSAQVSPILRHRFRVVEVEAIYTRGFLHYSRANTIQNTPTALSVGFDNSKNTSANVSLRSPDADAPVTWDTTYHHDRIDYDIAEPFDYDQVYAELGARAGRRFRLIGQVGIETDPLRHRTTGGFDSTSYKGGFEWREGERNEVRALVGHRFFGRTYEGLWRYTGRILESNVSYTEGPTTQVQGVVVRSITAPGDFPPGLGTDFSRTTSDVYLSKVLEGRIGMRGRLTDIFLNGSWERRDYIYLGNISDKSLAVNLFVSRRLGPRVTVEATAGYTDTTLREGGSYTDHTYEVAFRRQIGRKTQLVLSGNRTERTGSIQRYTVDWVVLGVEVSFEGTARAGEGHGFAGGLRPATRVNTLPTIPKH